MLNRLLLAAGLVALALAGCGKPQGAADPGDPYAGLDTQILAWRTSIEGSHPACAAKIDGKGCADFQVTCKAAQEITPDETARGVTAQVIAAMTFNGRTTEGGSGKPGSAFAVFSKAGGQWSRAEAAPVNLSSCAPA